MHVAFCVAPDYELFGGHVIQMEKTRHYLEAAGHRVSTVTDMSSLSAETFDLVHLWSPSRARMQAIERSPLPKVLTPIHLSRAVRRQFALDYYGAIHLCIGSCRAAIATRAKDMLRLPRQFTRDEDVAYVLDHCDLFLPNSEGEAAAVYADIGTTTPHHVVPNAVDPAFRSASPDTFVAAHSLRDFIICVGRFEPHKNQLRLIEALRGSGHILVLIGPPHPHHSEYFARCQAYFGDDIIHIPYIPHDDLPSAYAAARVSVLPSYYETTGLASLEAGLAGINVVTTERGYTREYFEDLAWYCDPARAKSIREAVQAAWDAPCKDGLRDKIMRCYTWDITAARTIEAYERAIALRAVRRPR